MLGGADGFGWKSGVSESRGTRIPDEKFGLHLYGVVETREGVNKSGEFVVEFTKKHVHRAQNMGLLSKTVMAAGQLAAVRGRLVRDI